MRQNGRRLAYAPVRRSTKRPIVVLSTSACPFAASWMSTTGAIAEMYDNLMLALAAFQKAGTTDGTAVRDVLRGFEYRGLLRIYHFSGPGGQSEAQINISEVKNNRPVVLSSLKAV